MTSRAELGVEEKDEFWSRTYELGDRFLLGFPDRKSGFTSYNSSVGFILTFGRWTQPNTDNEVIVALTQARGFGYRDL